MIYGSTEFRDSLIRIIREEKRHPNYKLTVKLAKDMSVHVYGDKPVDLLERARPGEDEEITEYRLQNFEPTTKAPCGKALKIVSKIFNPNLYSIVWPKDNSTAEELRIYTTYYYPVYNSLMVYNKDVTLKKMIADANAVMAVKPQRIPRNDAEKVKPIVTIYSSEDVWDYDLDHYLFHISTEQVTGGKLYTFEYYDYVRFIRFTAKSPKIDELELNILEAYDHNFVDERKEQEIPCWKLRGNTLQVSDGDPVYESFFADAQPHWNLSLIHESDVLGAFIKHMNPQRFVVGEECTHTKVVDGIRLRCSNGILRGGNPATGKGYSEKCDACNGSGKAATSPYETHVILKQKLDEMQNLSMDPIGYVKVPVDATKLLAERADIMVQRGNAAINMLIEDYVGANQSGVAKIMDRSAQSDTIYDIGMAMYDVHFQNQYYFINKYMNAVADSSAGKDNDANLPQVNKPTKFNVETVAELVNSFREGAAAGLDRNFMQAKQVEILSRDLDTNPDLKKYYVTIVNLDPLFGMTQVDVDANLAKGLVKKVDAVVHANLKPFVDKAMAENKDFLNMEKQDKMAILEGYAKDLIATEKPVVDPGMLPPTE
jgi:hypothetical protein